MRKTNNTSLMRGSIFGSILAFIAGCLWISGCVLQPSEPAESALVSDADVEVKIENDYISFRPKAQSPRVGFVFYPGGLVNERAYAPLCKRVAMAGFYVAIVPMPLNLAVFAPEKGKSVLDGQKNITQWAIGGHSLGGAMAARCVYQDSTLFRALVLYAAYPDASNDLSKRSHLRVLSISASLDGLATPEKIADAKRFLPSSTIYIVLEGGNHAQFGMYGSQNGDNPATMTLEEQQKRIADATIEFLHQL